MTHLRKKLLEAGMNGVEIRTETGIGYRLVVTEAVKTRS